MSGQLWNRMAVVVLALAAAACGDDYDNGNEPEPLPVGQVFSASGSVTASLTAFRTALGGDSANRAPGEQPAGRREVNWDGVGAPNLNVNTFPGDLFNTAVTRGQVFSTPGTGLRVSDNDAADIDSSYAAQFNPFSGGKTFFAIGSNRTDAHFQVAGSATAATVNGFGVIFSDVDVAGSSYIEFYTPDGTLLESVNAPVRSDSLGFSFVGVVFEEPVIGFARIFSGQAALAAGVKDVDDGGTSDLVIVDDFISGEPHAEPTE